MIKTKTELIKDLEEHAGKEGLKLNPNERVLGAIINGLLRNKEIHGEYYCPCRDVIKCKKAGSDLICPCINHLREVEEEGHCHCWLFMKK